MTAQGLAEFNEDGLLPEGIHTCDEETFYDRFVEKFPESTTRKLIAEGFLRLRHEVAEHGIDAKQWIDGSYVTIKQNPGDIDIVSFIDYERINSLPDDARSFCEKVLNGREHTKTHYQTHSFLVPTCSKDHPYYTIYNRSRLYWRKWFGTTSERSIPSGLIIPGLPKGIVEMLIGDPSTVTVIDGEGS